MYIFINYFNGMKQYIRNNNSKYSETLKFKRELLEIPFFDELDEFRTALKKKEYINSFMEFFDVIHSFCKIFVMRAFPEKVYMNFIVWIPVFILSYPVSCKLAYRQIKYGCIRNHINKEIKHNCDI